MHKRDVLLALLLFSVGCEAALHTPLQDADVSMVDAVVDQDSDAVQDADTTNDADNTNDAEVEDAGSSDDVDNASTLAPLNKTWEGFGRNAPVNLTNVYFVTNLNAEGPGSLAAAPSDSYVIFNGLYGDIVFPTGWVRNTPRTWIMGQTGNIQIRGDSTVSGAPTVSEKSSDTVWQYIRFRAGAAPTANSSHSPFSIADNGTSIRNVVMSHNSFQFGEDDNSSQWYDTRDVSWLDNLISFGTESFQENYSALIGGKAGDISYVRNLMMGDDRNPITQNTNVAQLVNNFIYTSGNGPAFQAWGGIFSLENTQANAQYNVTANTGNASLYFVQYNQGNPPGLTLQVYLEGNAQRTIGESSYTAAMRGIYGARDDTSQIDNYIVDTPFAAPTIQNIETDPAVIESTVVANAGASHMRDALDQSAIDMINNNVLPVSQTTLADYGGYPTMAQPTIPDIFDPTQADGLKASVKDAHGLDPSSNTLTTFINGGTSNDFLAILRSHGLIDE